MKVKFVQAYVEEDTWLRIVGLDQEVTGCSQSSQWHAFLPHFMAGAEFYFPINTRLWSASIYKQTAITGTIPDFI